MDPPTIEAMARDELLEEEVRERIDAAKARIIARRNRSWLRRVFPYSIRIERKDT